MASGISVDRDFARFGSKSYAINKINTVEVRERQPHGMGGVIIAGLIAGICFVAGFGQISQQGGGGQTIVIGLLLAGLAFWLWKRTKIIEYQLFLMTSSSETQAFVSNDHDEVMGLRDSIESAMTGR